MNDQRKVIYEQRHELMRGQARSPRRSRHARSGDRGPDRRVHSREGLRRAVGVERPARASCKRILGLDLPIADWAKEEGIADEIRERVTRRGPSARWRRRRRSYGPEVMRMAEKSLLLQILDQLLEGAPAAARPPAPRHPSARLRPARSAQRVQARGLRPVRGHADQPAPDGDAGPLAPGDPRAAAAGRRRRGGRGPGARRHGHRPARPVRAAGPPSTAAAPSRPVVAASNPGPPSSWGKVPRNAPCPCGSGKKYKHCHGRLT